jgi:hypothetical protein
MKETLFSYRIVFLGLLCLLLLPYPPLPLIFIPYLLLFILSSPLFSFSSATSSLFLNVLIRQIVRSEGRREKYQYFIQTLYVCIF